MEVDLLSLRRHVLGGDEGVHLRVDAHRTRDGTASAAELRDRFQELDVQLESDRRHVAGLLGAEQVARAADLEVAHRDGEAAPELGVIGEGGEPRPRLRRQLLAVGVEEVGVGQGVAPADPPANLVELRQPERVGPLDDERVGCGMSRPDSMIVVETRTSASPARNESMWPRAPARASGRAPPGSGARGRAAGGARPLLDRLDAVVEVEGLAAAGVLSKQRVAHQLLVLADGFGSGGAPAAASR